MLESTTMFSRTSAVVIGLLAACSPDEAGASAWRERLRAALYERVAPDGSRWGRWTLDPLLNEHTKLHLAEATSHARAIDALDGLCEAIRKGARLSAPEAALIQRDLWPVHDWAVALAAGDGRAEELARRVAQAMAAVALDAEAIARLPDALLSTIRSKRYPAAWDPAAPERPFLPTDLPDAQGVWVRLGDEEGRFLAPFHLRHHDGRSAFEVLVAVPEGPDATRRWVALVREKLASHAGAPSVAPGEPPDPPKGTLFVLLRRALLVDRKGGIRASPVVEALQLRVHGAGLAVQAFDQAMRDQPAVFEWHLARDGNLLVPVGADEEGFVLFTNRHHDPFERDWSPPGSMLHLCFACHHSGLGAVAIPSVRQVGTDGALVPLALFPAPAGREAAAFVRWKSARDDFARLRRAFRP